jgi:carbamoyl-phosphate synthase large subunit
MRSTGETLGIDRNLQMAIFKSYLGNYPGLNKKGKLLFSLSNETKTQILPHIEQLYKAGHKLMATKGTYHTLRQRGIECELVEKFDENANGISMLDAIKDDSLVAVFNTPMNKGKSKNHGEIIRNTAISFGIPCFTRVENIIAVSDCLLSLETQKLYPMALQEIKSIQNNED